MSGADPIRTPRLRGDFDLTGAPLSGANLIEAGAGTGKTYAITGLYVRLLVESGLPVRTILVVTYTVAATDELKSRIRGRIGEALRAFRSGEGDDELLVSLLAKFPGPDERLQAVERLTRAMRDFDEASIHTIHGFCQRVLQENAFQSGALFDTRMITDDRDIRREIVEDFWRSRFYPSAPEVAAYALEQKLNPESLLRFVGNLPLPSELRIIPEIEPPDDREREGALSDLKLEISRLRGEWPCCRSEVSALLGGPSLRANLYGSRVPGLMAAMDGFLAEPSALFPFPGFEKFTADFLSASVRRGAVAPDHPLFGLCGRILDLSGRLRGILDRHLLSLKRDLIRVMAEELPRRKQKLNVQYFDDLLLRLRDALRGRGGEDLARAIRGRYRAALIDEFQDTDPVQYAIFSTLFRKEGSTLFLIGDPKQAIYSFRGADIFAYLAASAEADAVHSLDANWRSDPALIRGVNALFSHRDHPFVFPEIAFRPARPGREDFPDRMTLDGRSAPPLQCWFVDADPGVDGAKPLPRGVAHPRIARAVAAEISRLLALGGENRARIGDRPLREGDIAILVRTNREARLCRESLAEFRVPAVLHSTGGLFATHEAMEMERLLLALLHPEREDLFLAALSTDMIGFDLGGLDRLRRDERTWEARREAFRSCHELWRRGGFLKMFRRLLDREGVRGRLLGFPDGDRRLTNCLHLAELLHREAGERNLGMTALAKWLSGKRGSGPSGNEEEQLRLESDARAVRIVTVHKSKGLQYPVVFCPFPWGGSSDREGALCFHDPADHGTVCDLGSDRYPIHRRRAAREGLAEEVRLFYVAVTRARNRCTFVWGRINGAGVSAPAYLFHGRGDAEDPVGETEERYRTLSGGDIRVDLNAIAEKSHGAMEILEMPCPGERAVGQMGGGAAARIECREFSGSIDRTWRVTSFSQLVSGAERSIEAPDRDSDRQEPGANPDLREDSGITDPVFLIPRGSRSGTLLHEILEKIDFAKTEESPARAWIAAKLRENGFDSQWQEAVEEMVRRVVRHPLLTGRMEQDHPRKEGTPLSRPASGAISLSQIAPDSRLNETGFYFPLKRLSRESLGRLFRDGARSADAGTAGGGNEPLGRLHFDPVRGFMRGFIDLVFRHDGRYYLVDWKSNYLGGHREDYRRERLAAVMAEQNYTLQYHLYVVALHRYLLLRHPGYDYRSHFGGVYYLFLRGMNPDWGPDYGVYQDKPAEERVALLCDALIGKGEGGW